MKEFQILFFVYFFKKYALYGEEEYTERRKLHEMLPLYWLIFDKNIKSLYPFF